jgi:hypothetical protein
MEYKLLVAYEVVLLLEKLPRRERQLLRDRMVAIAEWPAKFADYKVNSPTGPNLDVHVFGPYAITYWEDFADRHVKILNLKLADR